MPRKKNLNLLELATLRDFTINLEATSGMIDLFYVFLNDIKVIQSLGTKKPKWSGKVPNSIRIKVRVVGKGKATFKLGIDLPGTADDQSLTLTLTDGYYETEISL